ncbi:phytol kinase 1 VTE5 [Rhynchospora pubera]|uniref:phytol kinase n=1 Tax=Rhynchospora pubera TaxID=906938 RepID=A0AAV8E4H1_9POAL|nr:phytol kinase 1 VTE5 [Rhynchospora pubera]
MIPLLLKHHFSSPNSSSNLFSNRTVFYRDSISLVLPLNKPQFHRRTSRVCHMAALQDGVATVAVMAGAYTLVYTFDKLTQRQIIEQKLSRKIVHILSGVLFMSSWPLFSSSAEARYYAAIVPLLNCARLVIYGSRLFKDEALIKSVTREGNPEELLRGPLYYVIVLLFSVLVFWRDSPVGLVALAMMSGGDGFADIIGRMYGSTKLPYNRNKSWIGSISMFVSGFLLSIGILYYFSIFGYLHFAWDEAIVKVALVSFVATLVESLPITEVLDDNISVPIASMCTALLVFGSGSS